MKAETIKEIINRCGTKVAAARELNVSQTHLKKLEDVGAVVIDGVIHRPMKRRGRE
jgi:hypothetical protein